MLQRPDRADPTLRRSAPPFWVPIAAGLSIVLSLAVMALPELGHRNAVVYRVFYVALYLAWTVPLTWLQRMLWMRRVRWWALAAVVFAVTYAMSVANNALGVVLALALGNTLSPDFRWSVVFRGLESCWLSLIAFAAIHSVVAHAFELRGERERHVRAVVAMRDAELRALRYQLQPHFLFNTLNAVSSLVAESRNAEARAVIARLADFLRSTLENRQGHETTLAEELATAEGYLDIERARLGERLQAKWRIGADVLRARVPSMLLQPLIENAIRHGIATRIVPGSLQVAIERRGSRLHVLVANDTMNVAGDIAAGDRAGPVDDAGATPRGGRIGLRNLAERLQTLYPDDHVLTAGHAPGGEYRVVIDLPFRDGAGGDAT